MTKEEHNALLYKIIAIDRMNNEGKHSIAEKATLRILAKLVTEIYDLQHPSGITCCVCNDFVDTSKVHGRNDFEYWCNDCIAYN